MAKCYLLPDLCHILNPILPKLRKDDVTWGGGHYGPLLIFSSLRLPKALNLCTFLALKSTRKAILNSFRFLSLVTRGQQILVAITVEKFKIFKILSFKGVMHVKWKLRTCAIQIELEKVGFVSERIKILIFFPIFT